MSAKYTDEQNKQWLESLPKKHVAVKVIIKSHEGNVLVVKPNYKDTWQLIGGGVELNEEPKLAAVREVKEEVNLVINPNDLLIVGTAYKQKEDHLFLIYEYSIPVDEGANYNVVDKEIEAYQFIPQREVINLLPDYYQEFWNNYSN